MRNIWTIMKKELSRVFSDKKMVFMIMILPGLMIFLLYSVMGNAFNSKPDKQLIPVIIYINEKDEVLERSLTNKEIYTKLGIESVEILSKIEGPADENIKDKKIDLAIIFTKTENYSVTLLYNSEKDASMQANQFATAVLASLQKVEVGGEKYTLVPSTDLASNESKSTQVIALMLPFLIMTFLFQGAMSLGPESIAGDKERGTIATLLATPIKRSEIALGKIISLSILTMISAVSSFIGIILSLPKLLQSSELSLTYGINDYMSVLAILLSTVLVIIGFVSILSALAKNVKEAGMIALPLMLISMVVSMTAFISPEPTQNTLLYMLPLYNSTQMLLAIFSFKVNMLHFTVTVVSNLVVTGIAIYILTRMFNSEKIMFSK